MPFKVYAHLMSTAIAEGYLRTLVVRQKVKKVNHWSVSLKSGATTVRGMWLAVTFRHPVRQSLPLGYTIHTLYFVSSPRNLCDLFQSRGCKGTVLPSATPLNGASESLANHDDNLKYIVVSAGRCIGNTDR